ncbi:glycosyltransferase [Paenibacillus senegalensis]|uniref:glycosyltransferase n=1 Tax=Paenibacillus senegalensis TaxID=1465766 RepID=UPI0002898679|nr:glycosyltransferase [Paenibacillus senegalensis]
MSLIVYPPAADWTWMIQRPQQLMRQLARQGHRVYFCNLTQTRKQAEEIEPGLTIVHDHDNWLQTQWPKLREAYDGASVVWINAPHLTQKAVSYRADNLVYDCADDFAQWLPYEQMAINAASTILCSSQRLQSRLKQRYPGKTIHLVPNGYDEGMLLHQESGIWPKPADLPASGRPLIGFVGAWAPWLDEPLLYAAAKAIRDADWVFIGSEYERRFTLAGAGFPHVHFLGHKPHHQLPAYISRLDVCLIPFRINDVTLAADPVKAYEYLAAGKPVIATPMPECQRMVPYIDIAHNQQQFKDLIKARLSDPGCCEARIRFALANTWRHRAKKIMEVIPYLAAPRSSNNSLEE